MRKCPECGQLVESSDLCCTDVGPGAPGGEDGYRYVCFDCVVENGGP